MGRQLRTRERFLSESEAPQSLPSRGPQAAQSEQGSVPTKSRVAGGLSFLPSNPHTHAHANTHTHTNARLRVAPATAAVLPMVPRTQTMDLALLEHPGVDLALLGLPWVDFALLGRPGVAFVFLGSIWLSWRLLGSIWLSWGVLGRFCSLRACWG